MTTKPVKLRFHVTMVKPDAEGFDFKVWPSPATAKYIRAEIAKRIADGTNGYDADHATPTYFTTRAEAIDHARWLVATWGGEFVVNGKKQ